ncbi:DUF2076 family protein [Salinisphaera sp. SPP-AMP-43]|uniref:DUF2076 family protein n=1 Tax=Salinisphaera sp. SPP-AMP-43 TaxID=3121288 RepID=UPI003C6E4292
MPAPPSTKSTSSVLTVLFGGGSRNTPSARHTAWAQSAPALSYAAMAGSRFSCGGRFLGGALQTAVGVAGGMALPALLTGLFEHSQSEEIAGGCQFAGRGLGRGSFCAGF